MGRKGAKGGIPMHIFLTAVAFLFGVGIWGVLLYHWFWAIPPYTAQGDDYFWPYCGDPCHGQ